MSVMPILHSSTSVKLVLVIDERKRKRMASNRDSARRSRLKKGKHFDELIHQSTDLKNENGQIGMLIDMHIHHYLKIESENTILRNQVMELSNRIQSMNCVLQFVEEFSEVSMDISEIPNPILKPCELH